MSDRLSAGNSEKRAIEKKESISLHENATPSPPSQSTENINAKLANPLAGWSHEQLMNGGKQFAESHGLEELVEVFQKGALVAQDPLAFEDLPMLDDDDRYILRREVTHKWDQPKTLYYLVILCSLAAAVQGVRIPLLSLSRY